MNYHRHFSYYSELIQIPYLLRNFLVLIHTVRNNVQGLGMSTMITFSRYFELKGLEIFAIFL